jgi:hypothetical protein
MVVKKKAAAPAAMGKAAAAIIDFSGVKERGNFNSKNIEPGDYAGRATKVEQTAAKSDGEPMWVFTIVLDDHPRASYPYYCKLVENQFWKVKLLCGAVGIDVGQRKVKLDPHKLLNKPIGVAVEDDEYEGRLKSVIVDIFSPDDIGGATGDVEPEEDDLEEDEIEETPPPRKKTAKKPVVEEEDDEDEEEPAPRPKKRAKPAAKKPMPHDDEDEDDEDEDELEIDEL